jgi:hypothetical protein
VKTILLFLTVLFLVAAGLGCGGSQQKGKNKDKDKPKPTAMLSDVKSQAGHWRNSFPGPLS